MPAEAIATLVITGILVVALAIYLITIAVILRNVVKTLGLVTFGVRSIAHQTQPINELVRHINDDLGAVDEALQSLLAREPGRV